MPPRKIKQQLSEPGLVLRSFPSGEHDMILHVLLQVSGKKSFFLHSGKKNRKKYPTLPEIFDQGRFEYAPETRDIQNLSAYFPERSRRSLREDLDSFLCASLVFESLGMLAHEDGAEDAALFFQLAEDFLSQLGKAEQAQEKLRCVYHALVDLLASSGMIDPEVFQSASKHKLRKLVHVTQDASGRQLKSWKDFEKFCDAVLEGKSRGGYSVE